MRRFVLISVLIIQIIHGAIIKNCWRDSLALVDLGDCKNASSWVNLINRECKQAPKTYNFENECSNGYRKVHFECCAKTPLESIQTLMRTSKTQANTIFQQLYQIHKRTSFLYEKNSALLTLAENQIDAKESRFSGAFVDILVDRAQASCHPPVKVIAPWNVLLNEMVLREVQRGRPYQYDSHTILSRNYLLLRNTDRVLKALTEVKYVFAHLASCEKTQSDHYESLKPCGFNVSTFSETYKGYFAVFPELEEELRKQTIDLIVDSLWGVLDETIRQILQNSDSVLPLCQHYKDHLDEMYGDLPNSKKPHHNHFLTLVVAILIFTLGYLTSYCLKWFSHKIQARFRFGMPVNVAESDKLF